MENTCSFVVETSGVRLDRLVSDKCPELSRTQAQRLIEEGNVTVNDRTAKSSLKLSAGDRVTVTIPPTPPSPLAPEAMPLQIVYEDADLLVIDKPAGLTVHPAPGHPGGTLINAILAYYPRLAEISDSLRPGIVHRLDKDTSGLMIVAKNRASQLNLVEQFRARTVKKAYLALVRGKLTPETGIIEAAIGRSPSDRKRMAVVREGLEARTRYQVVKYLGGFTLLEVMPETGRTHQIRVHLAAIGYPVVGDGVYGFKSKHLSRQFLHAYKLGFKLPATGESVEFQSELPEDLARALRDMS
jgi:23S rRNA pseudouridine1911/1915/1917 synthase